MAHYRNLHMKTPTQRHPVPPIEKHSPTQENRMTNGQADRLAYGRIQIHRVHLVRE